MDAVGSNISNGIRGQPAPLDYGFTPPRRRRWIRRGAIAVLALALALAGYRWGPRAWQQMSALYWQGQCMKFLESAEHVVYEEEPEAARKLLAGDSRYIPYPLKRASFPDGAIVPAVPILAAALVPPCWEGLDASMSSNPRWFKGFGGAVIFLHERTSPAGHRRLVCVRYFPDTNTFTPQAIDAFNVSPFVIQPATFRALPMQLNVGWVVDVTSSWPRQPPLVRVFAGQPDPTDASHFSIRYQMWGQEDKWDGWLGDDDRITLIPSKVPQPA